VEDQTRIVSTPESKMKIHQEIKDDREIRGSCTLDVARWTLDVAI